MLIYFSSNEMYILSKSINVRLKSFQSNNNLNVFFLRNNNFKFESGIGNNVRIFRIIVNLSNSNIIISIFFNNFYLNENA